MDLALAVHLAADDKSDQDKIQGKWKIKSGLRGGQAFPEDVVKTAIIVFDGKTMKMTRTVDGNEQTSEMGFTLDPTKKPKAIDTDIMGKTGTGIYSLDGDTLKICHGDLSDERPTEFASKEGTKITLVVLKRVK